MSTPSRAPAGTPTGGQFAPGQHSDAGLELADPVHPPPDTAAVDAFWAEGDAISELRQRVDQRQRALVEQAAVLVDQAVRARYPDAARVDFLVWEGDGEDGDDTVRFESVRDSGGEILCGSDDGDELELPGAHGPTSFPEVAATVRSYVRRACNDSSDGFSLAVTHTYDEETTR